MCGQRRSDVETRHGIIRSLLDVPDLTARQHAQAGRPVNGTGQIVEDACGTFGQSRGRPFGAIRFRVVASPTW